jgi:sugar phosphate isomerase/epimerase/lysophospholipase L1-like esterase
MKFLHLLVLTFSFLLTFYIVSAQSKNIPKPLKVGYSVGIAGITQEKMTYAKSVGIDYLETSINGFIDKDRNFKYSDEEIIAKIKHAKKIADDAGIIIWSIHMPFSKIIDISLTDEAERKKVVALHQKVLKFCKILQPKIILFHPSYYLSLNEREQRKIQMIKSARELNKAVRAINADMVLENMLGFDLLVDELRERPLLRTVEEAVELMNRLPDNIYAAVDMNHIKNPEKLILAMGKRLKSVHIADGTGKQENHYFPCSGQGQNDWMKILAALEQVGYKGPFLYESASKDVKAYKECYLSLFNQYVTAADAKWVYTKATDLTLSGKVKETTNSYHRLDTVDYPALPTAVKHLLTNAAGIAVSFTTNSNIISAKWCVTDKKQLDNMTAIANKGLDLYIKKNGKWQFAGVGRPNADCNEAVLVKNMDNSEKECLLYLPLYDEVGQVEIGVHKEATIKAAATPFKKRILVYGSSIVQGASASRPGMAYPARLSRETGLNFLNLGFSGSAKMEQAAADMIASIPADAYILDCVPNSSPEQIKERTANFVYSIRKNHPQAPIIIISSIVREHGYFDQEVGKRVQDQNSTIADEIKLLKQKGVKDLYFIDADNLLGQDHEGTIDGTHPNDIGFDRMLQRLKPEILTILKKYAI